MSHLFDTPIGAGQLILLAAALLIACGFEFVNGFHDTANAVATVIYTRSLRPWFAVIISGTCNFLGVYLGGIAVAMSIIKLLPVELLAASGGGAGLAMVLSLLIAAILWNLGTWYFGLPASSSHTLIGAIVGVGLANSLFPGHTFGDGVNWHKVQEIGTSLVLSPAFGLAAAAALMLLARRLLKAPRLHTAPDPTKPPPWWVRATLISTCSGVSFAHGSNDGQKGVGLLMLILIGLLPADFALNAALSHDRISALVASTDKIEMVAQNLGTPPRMAAAGNMAAGPTAPDDVATDLQEIRSALSGKSSVRDVPADRRFELRTRIMRVDSKLGSLEKSRPDALSHDQWEGLAKDRASLRSAIDYAPSWVLVVVALSLGIGTMIGWKRIVVTVGEKIGKSHLTYSQGASAEIVAATTIGLSGWFGLPVSTTHVLSSGIAGTMIAHKSGLQKSTVRNIALAWVLTLPAAMILGGLLFLFFRSVLPDAKAATPAVHFDPHADDTAVVVPAADKPLRLHGSNTIGAELAPALAQAFLERLGASDVHREKDATGHAWTVSGTLPGEKKPLVIEIDAAGSDSAFEDLGAGNADLGMASRAATDTEADGLAENVIGLDGIAVIVNASNPTGPLSTETIARMFSGEITTWPADSRASGPVHVYARDDRSGTYATFKSLVLGTKPLVPTATRIADSEKLSDAVAADPQAIGFVAMPHVRRARAVAVSESLAAPVVPTPFTVATEDYPLSRRLYLYAPTTLRHPLSQDFVAFAMSPPGQAIVAANGFVDLGARAANPPSCDSCPASYVDATRGRRRMSIDFRFDTAARQLDARGQRDVDRLVSYLRTLRAPKVALLGFSDSAGDPQANLDLSRERAKRVADELTSRGIEVTSVDGLGGQMPVGANDTSAGRLRNRRVEVWITESSASP